MSDVMSEYFKLTGYPGICIVNPLDSGHFEVVVTDFEQTSKLRGHLT